MALLPDDTRISTHPMELAIADELQGDTVTTSLRIITYNALSLKQKETEPQDVDPQHTASNLNHTGLITAFTKALHTRGIDICCTQETRLRLTTSLVTQDYRSTHVNARAGRGGLITFIAKNPNISILQHHSTHPRIQRTTLRIFNTQIHIINTHAPVRDAPLSTHQDYQTHLLHTLHDLGNTTDVVIAGDLNARLGSLATQYSCIGPYTTPLLKDTHIEALLLFFSERNYIFLNTFHPPLGMPELPYGSLAAQHAASTWTAPGDHLHSLPIQIDYLIASPRMAGMTTQCYPLNWCEFATIHHTDHRPVLMIATLHCKTRQITTPPRLHRRFIDDTHKTKFVSELAQSIEKYKSNPLTHNLHPALQLHQVELLAQQAMQTTAPARVRPPTKSWLRLTTLRLLHDITTLRKDKAKLHKYNITTPPSSLSTTSTSPSQPSMPPVIASTLPTNSGQQFPSE
eukprot:6456030-Amphidinium_carterae.3